jgi:hypothetical protein
MMHLPKDHASPNKKKGTSPKSCHKNVCSGKKGGFVQKPTLLVSWEKNNNRKRPLTIGALSKHITQREQKLPEEKTRARR